MTTFADQPEALYCQPFQLVAESNMPLHLRNRLLESEKYRKVTKSQEEKQRDTIEAATRRDENIARKVMAAIETREKFFEPKELRFARRQYEKEQRLQAKLERAAAKRQELE